MSILRRISDGINNARKTTSAKGGAPAGAPQPAQGAPPPPQKPRDTVSLDGGTTQATAAILQTDSEENQAKAKIIRAMVRAIPAGAPKPEDVEKLVKDLLVVDLPVLQVLQARNVGIYIVPKDGNVLDSGVIQPVQLDGTEAATAAELKQALLHIDEAYRGPAGSQPDLQAEKSKKIADVYQQIGKGKFWNLDDAPWREEGYADPTTLAYWLHPAITKLASPAEKKTYLDLVAELNPEFFHGHNPETLVEAPFDQANASALILPNWSIVEHPRTGQSTHLTLLDAVRTKLWAEKGPDGRFPMRGENLYDYGDAIVIHEDALGELSGRNKGSVTSVHELGHALEHTLEILDPPFFELYRQARSAAFSRFSARKDKGLFRSFSTVNYARTKAEEYAAEGFALHYSRISPFFLDGFDPQWHNVIRAAIQHASTLANHGGAAAGASSDMRALREALSAPEETDEAVIERLRQMIERRVQLLQAIYRGTASERALSDAARRTLQKIGPSLLEKSEDYGVGTVLREVGRTLYSRPDVVEPTYQEKRPFVALWNILEEGRAGTMLKNRYPGANDYLRQVYEENFWDMQSLQEKIVETTRKQLGIPKEQAEEITQTSRGLPRHLQYLMGVLYEFADARKIDWDNPLERPAWVSSPDVIQSLNQTKGDYREVMRLKKKLFGQEISEPEIRIQSQDAYKIDRDTIWPVYEKLVEQDTEELQQLMDSLSGEDEEGQQAESGGSGGGGSIGKGSTAQQVTNAIDDMISGQLEVKGGSDGDGQSSGRSGQAGQSQPSDQKPGDGTQKQLGQRPGQGQGADANTQTQPGQRPGQGQGADANTQTQPGQQPGQGQGAGKAPGGQEPQSPDENNSGSQRQPGQPQSGGNGRITTEIMEKSLQELLRIKQEAEADIKSRMTPYQRYQAGVFQASQDLAGIINNIFEHNARPRYVRGQRHPGVIDMPSVVQYAARAARGEIISQPAIWKRREEPTIRDHAVIFLIDCSGSMAEDDKIDQAKKAWIMSAEALEQNHVPWGLIIFSDNHLILKTFDDQWDDQRREDTLAQIEDIEQGKNEKFPMSRTNDADAVKPAVEMIEQRNPTGVRLILPITDGQGKEDRMRDLVKEADAKGISIIGVGIDAAMEYIKRVYIHHAFAITLESLPSVLGTAIEERFEGAYD